jgi:hypothetical protein
MPEQAEVSRHYTHGISGGIVALGKELPARAAAHVLMGKSTPEKVQNMVENISQDRIAPVELIARKD